MAREDNSDCTTWKLARMNLANRRIDANLGLRNATMQELLSGKTRSV